MAEKRHVVGQVSHPKLLGKVDVFMQGTAFRAHYQGGIVDGVTYESVERQVLARMEATAGVDWLPVVELHLERNRVHGITDGSPTGGAVALQFTRYWFAVARHTPRDGLKDDNRGSWSGKLSAPWEAKTDAQRLAKAKNVYLHFAGSWLDVPRNKDGTVALPAKMHGSRDSGNEEGWVLLHTDALWASLLAIVARIRDTHAQLQHLVSTPETVKVLEGLGERLLAQPQQLALPPGDVPARARREKR